MRSLQSQPKHEVNTTKVAVSSLAHTGVRHWFGTSMFAAVSLALSACTPMATSFTGTPEASALATPSPSPTPTATPTVAAVNQLSCLDNQPDYILNTSIVSFQLTDSYGATVGVNFLQGLLSAIGLGVQYSSGDLTTEMHLFQPLNTTITIADQNGTATASSIKLDTNLGISILSLGFSYYNTTPIAGLSNSALANNLSNIVANIDDEWTSHVSQVYGSSQIEIPAGSKAGIQLGDEFAIYPVEWEFSSGTPCKGSLQIARRLSTTPIAIATVSQPPSASAAILTLSQQQAGQTVATYSLVTISKLANSSTQVCTTDFWGNQTCTDSTTRTTLNRSVRLGPVTGNAIPFDSGSGAVNVDITPYAAQQLQTLINASNANGLYLVQ